MSEVPTDNDETLTATIEKALAIDVRDVSAEEAAKAAAVLVCATYPDQNFEDTINRTDHAWETYKRQIAGALNPPEGWAGQRTQMSFALCGGEIVGLFMYELNRGGRQFPTVSVETVMMPEHRDKRQTAIEKWGKEFQKNNGQWNIVSRQA